eukprot:CAMPEP_0203848416 /NCGR_PEP_ID=MMETSP0359-20131031/5584_1 /ASSEMBLY_ACC=CAM_ASM_000338 /TAXON_ID=268821 /ORGANISM="Scrippsiella Hangoei, Strain SHTV-5" /LENGTH=386 /DNA_ID=CAMNT_0050764009 /DNA_START=31 /DNA_END=1191 /DNA_ORIENTATION=-
MPEGMSSSYQLARGTAVESKFPSIELKWLVPLFVAAGCMISMNVYLLVTWFGTMPDDLKVKSVVGIFATLSAATVLAFVPLAGQSATAHKLEAQHDEELGRSDVVRAIQKYAVPASRLSPFICCTILSFFFKELVLETPEGHHPPLWCRALAFIGYGSGGLAYCSIILTCMVRSHTIAKLMVQSLINTLETGHVTQASDWDLLAAKVHQAEKDINSLFSLSECGVVWCSASALAALFSALGMVMVVISDNDIHKYVFQIGCAWFFCGMIGALKMLLPLAMLTSMCKDPGVSSNSIVSAARRFPFRQVGGCQDVPLVECADLEVTRMSDSQKAAHHRFTSIIETNDMGVKLGGMRLTMSLLYSKMLQIGILLPSAYAFLTHHLHEAV